MNCVLEANFWVQVNTAITATTQLLGLFVQCLEDLLRAPAQYHSDSFVVAVAFSSI